MAMNQWARKKPLRTHALHQMCVNIHGGNEHRIINRGDFDPHRQTEVTNPETIHKTIEAEELAAVKDIQDEVDHKKK